ncbi:ribonuclease inhibitor [Clostridium cavendishii DSM 21758]|uniref:Ribonuclease inhibitor n=1 Tax=Clostridium cavendishii DSM 21758 TaxID=1121302 RepID=A0A1M6EZ91_9CLOT|nr:barstar family protein [Clostridium cavendishii]SHI90767.1 ribonuclease inhibitor [Clostridium cavendishii DSM 21758]
MKTVLIDGLKINSKEKLHEVFRTELNFPDYYGNNLDALFDVLSTDIEMPINLIFENTKYCKQYLGEYLDSTIEVLKNVSTYYPNDFIVTIN